MDGARQEVGFVSGRDIPNLVLKEKKFNRLLALINRSMLWKVKYSNILDEEKFIYYPYLDDMGHVTDPYLLWYNEFKAAGKDVDTYLGAEITE